MTTPSRAIIRATGRKANVRRDYELEILERLEVLLGILSIPRGKLLDGRIRPDGMLALGRDSCLVVEVEKCQSHPDTNVLKYWRWLEARKSRRVILVHWYIAGSPSTHSARAELACWIAEKMRTHLRTRFQYFCVTGGKPTAGDLRGMREAVANGNATQ